MGEQTGSTIVGFEPGTVYHRMFERWLNNIYTDALGARISPSLTTSILLNIAARFLALKLVQQGMSHEAELQAAEHAAVFQQAVKIAMDEQKKAQQ